MTIKELKKWADENKVRFVSGNNIYFLQNSMLQTSNCEHTIEITSCDIGIDAAWFYKGEYLVCIAEPIVAVELPKGVKDV